MPDDSEELGVEIRRNDFAASGEAFQLKADNVKRQMQRNLLTKAVLSAAGDIAGKDIDIGTESYTISGPLRDEQADTYPKYTTIDKSAGGLTATEKEMNLALAARTWGPDLSDGFDVLRWGPREITGMISEYTADEETADNRPGTYSYTISWTHATVYVGGE